MRKPPTILLRLLAASLCVATAVFGGEIPPIETAGDLYVEVYASDFDSNSGRWTNDASCTTCIDDFLASGSPTLTVSQEGAVGIALDGINDFFTSDENAPAGLTGIDATRSIEVWALNPSIVGEETLVSWGKRGGPDGTNMAFNYGNHGNFGAVGHWGGGGPDIGWIDNEFTPGAPTAGEWHHLVYTYDGTTTRVYAGSAKEPTRLWNSEVLGPGVINTFPDLPILIGSQTDADGVTPTAGLRGNLTVGEVRVHDGVLTDQQIITNWAIGLGDYPNPEPPPLPVAEPIPTVPNHRYPFLGEDIDILIDVIGEAHGSIIDGGPNDASLSAGQLRLTGGDKTLSDYAEFPSGIVTATAASGDVGDLTIEVWGTTNSAQNWSRVFSFGSATDDVIHMSWSRGEDVNQNELRFNQDGQGLGNLTLQDFGPNVIGEESHWTVVIDDDGAANGDTTISVYQDGLLKVEGETSLDVATLGDDSVWLGRSQWADATANADYNEFRLYDYALTANQVLGNFEAGPDVVNTGIGCDFDANMICDIDDIDALMADAANGSNSAAFDLTNDGLVNDADRDAWLALAGPANDFAEGFLIGDSNLDGKVDATDLNEVGISWQNADETKWSNGNFVTDAGTGVDANDLNGVGINWQNEVALAGANPVPEPSWALIWIACLSALVFWRRQ